MTKQKRPPQKVTIEPQTAPAKPWPRGLWAAIGAATIIALTFIIYSPSFTGGFILDDDALVSQNKLLHDIDGLRRIWCTTEAPDYWPITYTSFWIEWRLWQLRPLGYIIDNVILHIAASLLIWIVLRKLAIPGAFLAALIFAIHPVNVESVAWISQRKNTLAMLFFLLSILWYLKFEASRLRSASILWYHLSLFAFVLSMLSKGSVAVLPVLLLGIIWWQRTSKDRTPTSPDEGRRFPLTALDFLWTIPYFAIAAVLTGVNIWFQKMGSVGAIRPDDFWQRLLGAGGVVWFYLYKALWPADLAFVYPQWSVQVADARWWMPLFAAIAVTGVLWWYRNSWSRPFLFAWGFFCVSLLPVMGFTDVGYMKFSLVADHYQHIAIIGVIALVTAGWCLWHRRTQGPARAVPLALAGIVVIVLAVMTWHENTAYCDSTTFYKHAVQDNPHCWMLRNNLGKLLLDADKPAEAIEHLNEAIKLNANDADANLNFGKALNDMGRPSDALGHYQKALELHPRYAGAYNNLGNALTDLDRLPEAFDYFEKALAIDPDHSETHSNYGWALTRAGRVPEALKHLNRAVELAPDNAKAHYNLGVALCAAKQIPTAAEHFQTALRLKPDFAQAHNNLGFILVQQGKLAEAVKHYQDVTRLKPNDPAAALRLTEVLVRAGRHSDARVAGRKALSLARATGDARLIQQAQDWLKKNLRE